MIRAARTVLFLIILSSPFCLLASSKTDSISRKLSIARRDTVAQLDLMDLMHSLMHTGMASGRADSVGLKPVISAVPAFGYSMQSRMAVLVSGNAAFRTAPQAKISTINYSTSYTQNGQFTLPIMWNV